MREAPPPPPRLGRPEMGFPGPRPLSEWGEQAAPPRPLPGRGARTTRQALPREHTDRRVFVTAAQPYLCPSSPRHPQGPRGPRRAPGRARAAAQGTDLQLGLEEELLRTLRAVVDLVLLSVHGEDMLLQLVGLDEDCRGRGLRSRPPSSHTRPSDRPLWQPCWCLPEAAGASGADSATYQCAALGKSLNLSGLHFLTQKVGVFKNTSLTEWLGGPRGLILHNVTVVIILCQIPATCGLPEHSTGP